MKRSLTLATLIALGAAAYAPLPSMAGTDVQVYIGSAPPAPLYERAPMARRGYVWSPGYWEWNGHRHHWIPGSYIVERPGYMYAPPAWRERGGRWYIQQGYWAPRGGDRYYAGNSYRHDGYRHDGYRHDGYRDDGYRREVYYDRYGNPHPYRGRDRDRDGIPDRIERYGGDTDRDGIPNARDRDRDNDGVPNKYDHDRDGDGRRNSRDSSPDNPYRR